MFGFHLQKDIMFYVNVDCTDYVTGHVINAML